MFSLRLTVFNCICKIPNARRVSLCNNKSMDQSLFFKCMVLYMFPARHKLFLLAGIDFILNVHPDSVSPCVQG